MLLHIHNKDIGTTRTRRIECHSNQSKLGEWTDFASEQFLFEREDRYLLTLVFRSAI